MKKIPVEKAVGMILSHDITQIVPEKFKGRAFKKGHIIQKEDVDKLLELGKRYIYVYEPESGEIHEDDASLRISKAVTGENIELTEPSEGKITLKSLIRGLFKVNSELLHEINSIENVTIASLPNNFKVEKGESLAGVRIVPLTIEEEKIKKIEKLCEEKGAVFTVKNYKKLKAAFIITGNEVYEGLIQDGFAPILREKFSYFGAELQGQSFCPDNIEEIKKAILQFNEQGANVIVLTGGMSVDPDDVTPRAIRESSTKVVTHGVPVQPGNMFMLAYMGETVLLGVPGAALYYKTTILDVVLPRIFTEEILTKEDFIKMGEGGFCLNCPVCHYPQCYFGR